MGLNKVTYVDLETLIEAQNLNDIQDAIIANEDATDYALAAFATDTASGAVATFTDGADNIPVKDMTVQIVPAQAGSGDPSPSNPRAISGWTEANVSHTGKNLYIAADITQGYYYDDNLDYVSNAAVVLTDYIPLVGGTNLYYRMVVTGLSPINLRVNWFDEHRNILSQDIEPLSANSYNGNIAIPANAVWARLSTNPAQFDFDVLSIVDTQDAVVGTTYTVSWQDEAGTVYGGTAEYIGGGKWRVTPTMASVDLGDLSWTYNNLFRAAFSEAKKPSSNNVPPNAICEQYAPLAVNDYNSDNNVFMISQQGQLWINDTTYGTDADAFTTAVTDVKLVYELATPLTPVIVDGPDPATLYGNNNIWANTGDVSVTYRADTALYVAKIVGA